MVGVCVGALGAGRGGGCCGSVRWVPGLGDALAQHPFEVAGSLGCSSAASRGRCQSHRRDIQKRSAAARSMAGSRRHLGAVSGRLCLVGLHQGRGAGFVQAGRGGIDAPVVQAHGQVVAAAVGAGKVEVEGAAQPVSGRRCRRTSRCRGTGRHAWGLAAAPAKAGDAGQVVLEGQFVVSATAACTGARCGNTSGAICAHQARPRRLCAAAAQSWPPPGACVPAWRPPGRSGAGRAPAVAAGQAVDHGRRLARQLVHQDLPSAPGCGSGTGMPRCARCCISRR
jgi:hypothetical protein